MNLSELLVTLSIVGILASWGWPSWQSALLHAQVRVAANAWLQDVRQAQWLAVQLAQPVRIIPKPQCSQVWSCGWHIVSSNANQVLRVRNIDQPLRVQFRFSAQPASPAFDIHPTGRLANGAMHVAFIHGASPASPPTIAITACLSVAGRWRLTSGVGCAG